MSNEGKMAYRIAVQLVMINIFREVLEVNGNFYSGSLVPNLQSFSEFGIMPYEELVEHVNQWPPLALQITPELVRSLRVRLFPETNGAR